MTMEGKYVEKFRFYHLLYCLLQKLENVFAQVSALICFDAHR